MEPGVDVCSNFSRNFPFLAPLQVCCNSFFNSHFLLSYFSLQLSLASRFLHICFRLSYIVFFLPLSFYTSGLASIFFTGIFWTELLIYFKLSPLLFFSVSNAAFCFFLSFVPFIIFWLLALYVFLLLISDDSFYLLSNPTFCFFLLFQSFLSDSLLYILLFVSDDNSSFTTIKPCAFFFLLRFFMLFGVIICV